MQQMRFWLVKIQNSRANIQQPKPPQRPFDTASASDLPPVLTDEDYARAEPWQPDEREEPDDDDSDQ
ncbi:hypothetical protein [Hoyosella altamirensis]|uniref:Uncharacterized protein n=1 Tax=Hoyosella altamirensis TaxID=616997 RepID=A0A839RUA1_9ACTN|nr:hypothetical protein [Hoyosella altamirensis]MBB3040150.1 hypothetical protein [Hoyosella altamirensis]